MNETPNPEQIMEQTATLIETEIKLMLNDWAETRSHQELAAANNPNITRSPDFVPYKEVQDILERDTYDQCSVFCTILAENPETRKQGFKHERESQHWPFHVIAVFQDSYGYWYAASPANHHPETPEITKQVLSAKTLSILLEKIQKFAGGEWPTEAQIKQE